MNQQELLDLGTSLLQAAKAAGADQAEVSIGESQSREVSVRGGKTDASEQNDNLSASLSVLVDQRKASVSLTPRAGFEAREFADRAVAIAMLAPESPFAGLAEQVFDGELTDLDLFDPVAPTVDELVSRAAATEASALAVKGVTQCERTFAVHGFSQGWLLTSDGFQGYSQRSSHAHGVQALAGEGDGRLVDYAHSSKTHAGDLETPEAVGREAGMRAVREVGAIKPKSGPVSALFEPRTAATLVRTLLGAMKGSAIARRSTFLIGKIDEVIASEALTLTDDPLVMRGSGSRLFDSEGVACQALTLLDAGRLTTWLLNSPAARELGLRSTGHASGGGIGSSNVFVNPGEISNAEMIKGINHGVLITKMMGHGADILTGTFSLGVSGLLIENGEITRPFSEATLAGDFQAMLKDLTLSNELETRGTLTLPTFQVEGVTLAGA